jgi:hypothetical protein
MLELIALFLASFFNVFLLGLNSQFVRDRFIGGAVFLSFNISFAQFIYTRVIAHSETVFFPFIFSAFGGASGIASSIIFYAWFNPRFHKWNENRNKLNEEQESK